MAIKKVSKAPVVKRRKGKATFNSYIFKIMKQVHPETRISKKGIAIINNFVTERNSSEVMAVGLNAVWELCARYCRVFIQIFPTPSDCQVSSCDD